MGGCESFGRLVVYCRFLGSILQIDPDIVEDQRKNPERKKLKLKEVYLTKLLSTKARGTSHNALFTSSSTKSNRTDSSICPLLFLTRAAAALLFQ